MSGDLPDPKAFQERYRISDEAMAAAGMDWADLEAIHRDHVKRSPELDDVAQLVARRLSRLDEVHSTRTRVKGPEHLLEKIIRKRAQGALPAITPESYTQHITDLIGVRALHLLKNEWRAIHEAICGTWDLKERPQANVRKGDSAEVVEQFRKEDCEIREHPDGYRSVHYLLKCAPQRTEHIVEVQVRTIFEEGWSEIDHRVRYPYAAPGLVEQLASGVPEPREELRQVLKG